MKKDVLIVDGYNMIGAWPELVKLKNLDEMATARNHLLHELSNYSKYEGIETRVIFDAQLVPGIQKNYKKYALDVVFTKEDETADSYIERTVGEENSLITHVTVATSDMAEQWMIFQKGASRQSALELYRNIQQTKKHIQTEFYSHKKKKPFRSPFSDTDLTKLWDIYEELTTTGTPEKQKKKQRRK